MHTSDVLDSSVVFNRMQAVQFANVQCIFEAAVEIATPAVH